METPQLTNRNTPMVTSQFMLRTMENNLGLELAAGGNEGSIDLPSSLEDALQADANQIFDVPCLRPQQLEAIKRVLTDVKCLGRLVIVQRTGE